MTETFLYKQCTGGGGGFVLACCEPATERWLPAVLGHEVQLHVIVSTFNSMLRFSLFRPVVNQPLLLLDKVTWDVALDNIISKTAHGHWTKSGYFLFSNSGELDRVGQGWTESGGGK